MSKFTPSPAEVALVNQIFAQADTQKLGVITGDAAVKIFSGSKLPPTVLADIWNLADEDNNGVLTRKGVAVAIRLLGHAQRGEKVTEALINRPGPVPTIDGLTPPLVQQTTGIPSARSPPPGLPALTAQDKAKFMKLFIGCGPANGLLSGDKARDVFVKSKLPVDKLSQIWSLADTKNRGALDATDFTIAMYLIQASMSGHLQTLPSILPPGLYEQAGGKPAFDGVAVHATGGSGSYSPSLNSSFPGRPVSTLEPHFTGQGPALQQQMTGQMRGSPAAPPLPARSALANSAFSFVQPQSTGVTQQQHWDVTPAEKASADQFFETLDTQKKGYIEGDVAVPFMLQSKLPEDDLARVWDLADLNNDGRLTRDGFAVAMHLIQGKLNGKELPVSIPSTLIPPSMRTPTAAPAPPSQASVHDSIRDLIWDDSPPASATMPPPQQPALQPQSTGVTASRTPIASPPRSQTMPDPFTNSSSFATSSPFSASSPFAAPPAPPAVHHDLLGDDEEPVTASSPPLQDQSAEIGNVKNQLNSTNRSLEVAKAEREDMERKLSEQAAELSSLQTQLSSAKAAYETETRLLGTLRERYSSQSAEIRKAREELIHSESDLSAIRVEKTEVEGALLRDKEEVRELQRKMTEVGMQVETTKAEVEKAKKEAKQQKGLLAIAKKQLATRETERAKVQKELDDAQNDLAEAAKEREEAEAELAKEVSSPMTNGHRAVASPDILAMAVAQPLPATPDIPTSPTGSVMSLGKSNNPFERVSMASGPGSRAQSPFLPFTNSAVLPTPPTAPVDASTEAPTSVSVNPFRFSQVFAADDASPAPQTSTETTEPPATASPIDLMSPTDTEMFHTPPTTATLAAHSPLPPKVEAEGVADVPDLAQNGSAATSISDGEGPAQPPGIQLFAKDEAVKEAEQTDLNHQLKELDVEDSDSDSDSDESHTPATQSGPSSGIENVNANGDVTSSTIPEVSAFDDSFGVSMSTEESRPISPSLSVTSTSLRSNSVAASVPKVEDIFGAPFIPPVTTQEPSTAPEASGAVELAMNKNSTEPSTPGVNDFDEAMGKISASPSTNGGPSQAPQFSFDSAFDDNFDFAAASVATGSPSNGAGPSAFPPPPATAHAPSHANTFDSVFMSQLSQPGTSGPQPAAFAPAPAAAPGPFGQAVAPEAKPFSFDDAFSSTSSASQMVPSQSGSNVPSHGIAFDDAFGGRSLNLALDNSFGSSSQQSTSGPGQATRSTPFPTTSPPLSPIRTDSPLPAARRSTSPPPRQMSPPPRHSSPKPRPSTASSDKEKAPSARHSKLSIRLPFGRKKKTHDVPPMPPPLATQQLLEEPTPAVDDDIPAVKQLCGMGFSRTQAVTALELHDYDMQRALNSLLGTS